MRCFISFLLTIKTIFVFSNETNPPFAEKKQMQAIRLFSPPKIDGFVNEDIWQKLPVARDFVQHAPIAGEPCSFPTEVRIGYDNSALYIGAKLYDPSPDSVATGLGKRDEQDVNSDIFAITIDPYNNGLSAFEFWVTASGVQIDKYISLSGGGVSWDAVWESSTQKTPFGWSAEMKIPFSAIRFPNKDIQTWGIILWRNIRRYDEWATWDLIDPEVHGTLKQSQKFKGIKEVEPPVRLSFTPYVSGYLENYSQNNQWNYTYNGGMDLKYGINESFTLDMTLVPDFGQVQSDDKVMNLSPYEVKYSEKRQFFTEGVELFNKSNVFYSRRIGSQPVNYYGIEDELYEHEAIIHNPMETRMINASKISGRNSNGTGMGVFNAMTAPSYAKVKDTLTNEKRHIKTQGFTNYNLLVVDQNLKNNSFVSLINTNVMRPDDNYAANVTGSEFRLINNKNTYSLNGHLNISQKYTEESPEYGHKYYLNLSRIHGNFRFSMAQNVETDTYDPNDLGFLSQNNELTNSLVLNYNKYKPFGRLMNWYNELRFTQVNLYNPREFSEFAIDFTTRTKLKNNHWLGSHAKWMPGEKRDFFEPRVDGWYLKTPQYHHVCAWYNPENIKTFDVSISGGYLSSYNSTLNMLNYWYSISPKWRLNDKLNLSYTYFVNNKHNNLGWVDYNDQQDTIFIGKRDQHVVTNTFSTNYIFNSKSSLSLRLRHYWSTAIYDKFFELEHDGDLRNTSYSENNDRNFNLVNLNMSYIWNFAPGSEFSLVWKNEIFTDEAFIRETYLENVDSSISADKMNTISMRVLYYLDYNYLKKII